MSVRGRSGGEFLPYFIDLERAFLSREFRRANPSAIRIVGTLLDSAFARPPASREIDRLAALLKSGSA